jgi:hypothetical protein
MTAKPLHIDPGVDPLFRGLIEKAEPAIERVLGDAANRVDVDWEPGSLLDGKPTVRIRFKDAEVSRFENLTAPQLENENHLRHRLFRLWDQVLAERIRNQQQRVRESLIENGEA